MLCCWQANRILRRHYQHLSEIRRHYTSIYNNFEVRKDCAINYDEAKTNNMVFMEILSHIFFFKYAISSNNICQMIFWVNLELLPWLLWSQVSGFCAGSCWDIYCFARTAVDHQFSDLQMGSYHYLLGSGIGQALRPLQSTPVDTFWPQNAFSHNLYANYFGIIFSHQRRLTFNSFGDALLSSMWLLLLPEANRHFINISQK